MTLLYLLCRMYDKHVYVHTACFSWCTIPTKFDTKLSTILPKCDLELVLLDCWSFGKVVKIRWPNTSVSASTGVIPKNVMKDKTPAVIPQNVSMISPCSVSVERLATPQDAGTTNTAVTPKAISYDMHARPAPRRSLTALQAEKDQKWTIHSMVSLITHLSSQEKESS